VQLLQAGLGLGLGVRGQGQAELGLGGQGVLGRFPDQSPLALLKNLNSAIAPQLPRLKHDITLITPPPKSDN